MRLLVGTLFAASSFLLTLQPASAQYGSSVGTMISGTSGGGCQNLTGFTPPALPQPPAPGRIPCSETMETTSTVQGDTIAEHQYPSGSFISAGGLSQHLDALGSQFSRETVTSAVSYGQGFEHYAEYAFDGVNRSRWFIVNVPDYLPSAINRNPDFPFARATAFVVDGRAISMEMADGRQYLEVNTGESKLFEILLNDPENPAALNNPFENPFTIDWVNPNSQTPHSEIPGGVTFRADYDSAAGKWRYFLQVIGSQMPEAGRYAVHFAVRREQPVQVQYNSLTQGLLTWNEHQRLSATVTLAYGLDQCVIAGVLSAPSLQPHLQVYELGMKEVRRSLKIATKALGSSNSALSVIRRRVRDSGRYLVTVRQLDADSQATDLARINPVAAQKMLEGLRAASNRLVGLREVGVAQKVGLIRLQRKLRKLAINELAGRPEARKMVSKNLRLQVKALRSLNKDFASSVATVAAQVSVSQLAQAECESLFP